MAGSVEARPVRRLLLVPALLALVVAVRPAAAQVTDGPTLETDAATLAAALRCPDAFTHPDRDPVLLVHGTATTSEASWSWSLGTVLPAQGYDVCTVDLPERALVDQQTSAEYVVHAVREMAGRSERAVDVIGHSQGTLEPRWAMRWWPDVRAAVDELVQLAPPNQGTASAQLLCSTGSCPPAASALPGATVIVIQDLCPARYVGHVQLLADAVAVAVVLDALGTDGPADASRIDPATCLQGTGPGTDPVEVSAGSTALYADAAAALPAGPMTDAEPPLRAYAARTSEPQGPTVEEPPAGAPPPPASAPGARPTLPATGGSGVPVVALGMAAAAVLVLGVLRR